MANINNNAVQLRTLRIENPQDQNRDFDTQKFYQFTLIEEIENASNMFRDRQNLEIEGTPVRHNYMYFTLNVDLIDDWFFLRIIVDPAIRGVHWAFRILVNFSFMTDGQIGRKIVCPAEDMFSSEEQSMEVEMFEKKDVNFDEIERNGNRIKFRAVILMENIRYVPRNHIGTVNFRQLLIQKLHVMFCHCCQTWRTCSLCRQGALCPLNVRRCIRCRASLSFEDHDFDFGKFAEYGRANGRVRPVDAAIRLVRQMA